MLSIVVMLSINDEAAFLEFEGNAMEIMSKYGGELTLAFRPTAADSGDDEEAVDEIHVLQFPDSEAFTAYRSDAELQALSELRLRAIKTTRVYLSGKHIEYGGMNNKAE